MAEACHYLKVSEFETGIHQAFSATKLGYPLQEI